LSFAQIAKRERQRLPAELDLTDLTNQHLKMGIRQ